MLRVALLNKDQLEIHEGRGSSKGILCGQHGNVVESSRITYSHFFPLKISRQKNNYEFAFL